MGLFSSESKEERKVRKLSKRLGSMFAQKEVRYAAADGLAALGTPAAIAALLGRFEESTSNHTIDREEKRHVVDLLTDLGTDVIKPVRDYILSDVKAINYPLRVLAKFEESDAIAELIAEMLEEMDTEYTRNPEKKEQLVLAAGDYKSERLAKALIPFLGDANELVRFHAADVLFKMDYAFAAEPMAKRLSEEESGRVMTRLVDGFAERDWQVTSNGDLDPEQLPYGFAVTGSGTIRRRAS
ncbi:MAG: HEAT repeat domain-containing protein [Myxococcales bacterium]|nr:HEAT repeat domain-containing protein [Myxococcales bacterium]